MKLNEMFNREKLLRQYFFSILQEDFTKPKVFSRFSRTTKVSEAFDRQLAPIDVSERTSKSTAKSFSGDKLVEQHLELEFAG